jgi:hypothetical protein
LRAVTTVDVFKHAERIEAIAATIYAFFARQFAGDEKARALFKRLEAEEIQHATRVRLLAARYVADRRLIERFGHSAELEACLHIAEAALVEVNAGAWGADVTAVKLRLAELEIRLARAHAQAIAEGGHPALRDFFRQLALQDEAHAQLLKP